MRALITTLILVVLGWFLYLWLMGGGWQTVQSYIPKIIAWFNLQEEPTTGILLPSFAMPSYLNSISPISGMETSLSSSGSITSYGSTEKTLQEAEAEYDALRKAVAEARTFGDPSPSRGAVTIGRVTTTSLNEASSGEHVTLTASGKNTTPINITGWSLQSLLSGDRVYIPQGVRTFKMGAVGSLSEIYLDPGGTAILTTGKSPVGVSFRENMCSAYLGQFQTFSPSLDSYQCPSGSTELPATVENLQTYGEECVSFVSTLRTCSLYTGNFPPEINPACRAFVRGALTYNGCVDRYEWRSSFGKNSWRIFLNKEGSLWRSTHDVVRLLDTSGRTVDVYTY
jgi:hypothetical protein